MNIAVINYSGNPTKGRGYNLATAKMVKKFTDEGNEVFYSTRADGWARMCEKAFCSVLFTYELPMLVDDLPNLVTNGVEVEVGGPAVTAMMTSEEPEMKKLLEFFRAWKVEPHNGLDERFEHVKGNFEATFTSRGCPRGCEFCLVPKLEGRHMIEYEDYNIPSGKNPFVCDNNILATSWQHQERFVENLKGVRNLDINSGFDDRIFNRNPEKYWSLYSQLKLECWRFAYDKDEQREEIKAAAEFLHGKGVDYRHIIVFCLVGWPGTTFEYAQEKLQFLVDIGTSPYPMRYRPLDNLAMHTTPEGWKEDDMSKLFAYYGVPFVWRSTKWDEFKWPR